MIKEKMKKNTTIVALYDLCVKPIRMIKKISHERIFVENSMFAMERVQTVLSACHCRFFFDMGTLLGIYRDGKLLKHDMDIDVAVFPRNIEEIHRIRDLFLQNDIFIEQRFVTKKRGVIQDTFDCHGVRVDIHYYRIHGEIDSCYLLYDERGKKNLVVELVCGHVNAISSLDFQGVRINVPENIEQYLIDRYGKNWMVPDGHYKYWLGPGARKCDDKGKMYLERKK